MEKMTKRDYFTRILSYAHEEDKAFIERELELLNRKNSKPAKPTAKQAQNAVMVETIHKGMENGKAYTASDILALFPELHSVQKASALLKQMKDAAKATRVEVKGKAYFYKV